MLSTGVVKLGVRVVCTCNTDTRTEATKLDPILKKAQAQAPKSKL
jgi:hypothetical protein